MSRWAGPIVLLLLLPSPGCDQSACTTLACDHEAVVTYASGTVSAAYDLSLSFDGTTTLAARCFDPGAPEAADNAPELTCDLGGFTIVGGPAAARDVLVTITDTETGELLVDGVEVRLDAVDEVMPNGPDCPPTCFVRNGQLVGSGPD